MDKLLRDLPWWVKWVAVPVIALVVFGTIIAALVSFVLGLLFKLIVFVILVGALVLVVKRVTSGGRSSNSSRRDW
jgi:membrane protein implicated in regulation of membrane protease activity